MRLLCLLFALAFLASLACAQVAGPRILVSRSILNHELLINKDAVVNVEIYNVGEESAYDIEYRELGSFDEFETVIGAHSASWPKLAPYPFLLPLFFFTTQMMISKIYLMLIPNTLEENVLRILTTPMYLPISLTFFSQWRQDLSQFCCPSC